MAPTLTWAKDDLCVTDPWKRTICVPRPTKPSGGGSGSSSSSGSDDGGGSSSGTYREPRVDRRAEQHSYAVQAADAWEATADKYFKNGDYQRAIEVYGKALDVLFTKNREQYYKGKQEEVRYAWLGVRLNAVQAAWNGGRYDEIPDLLDKAEGIWYSKEVREITSSWRKALAENANTIRAAKKLDAEAAKTAREAVRRAADLRKSLTTGSFSNAARLLDNAMNAEGVAGDRAIETSVVQAARDVLGNEGLLEFQKVNNEYRAYRNNGMRLMSGSIEGDRRYAELRDAVASVPKRIEVATQPTNEVEREFATLMLEAAGRLAARVEELRDSDSSSNARAYAEELRTLVLRSAVMRRAVAEATKLPTGIRVSVVGESDRETLAFIQRIQDGCVGARNPTFCAAFDAKELKAAPGEDERLYPSRRNAEHYLAARNMMRQMGLIGPLSLTFATPLYAVYKGSIPGPKYATSPPTWEQIQWGYLGIWDALMHQGDPSLPERRNR